MSKVRIDGFPQGVAEKLKTYVYRLIDPRNGETFYVGKGVGNRIFSHIREEVDAKDPSNKLKRIREIHLAGFDVAHVIHRHGMDHKTAFEVEAALIEAYPGLTNIAGGSGNGEFGVMHADEIIRRYAAKPAELKHKALLININSSAAEHSLYEATRYAWKLSKSKAEEVELVLAHSKGMIVGAFIPEKWLPATAEHFPGREEMPGRLGFVGIEAPEHIRQSYIGCSVPEMFRKRGAANPIKYSWGKNETNQYIKSLFTLKPKHWGLRGDPYLWKELEESLGEELIPESESELLALFENAYETLVGCPLSQQGDVYIERYNHGGMSSGVISSTFWREKGLPLLLQARVRTEAVV